jgi:hypothetical protein
LVERGFVATLTLGIGVNATMFGIAGRLLVRGPEHVRDSGRVVRVYSCRSACIGLVRAARRAGM